MTWNGTLITLTGADRLFGPHGWQFSHNWDLEIYEAKNGTETLRAKTLIDLCSQVLGKLTEGKSS